MSDTHDNSGGYRVGYGRPPAHTRFTPGQSGNPAGRPAGRKNFATLLQEALDQQMAVSVGRRRRVVTRREAAAFRLAMKAAKGDPRAIAIVLRIEEAPENKPPEQIVFRIGKEDAGH